MYLWQAKNRGVGAPRRGEEKEGPKEARITILPVARLVLVKTIYVIRLSMAMVMVMVPLPPPSRAPINKYACP